MDTLFADELHRKHSRTSIKRDWIFVSVASYRDPRCSQTLLELFQTAANPERIVVGVCQQNAPADPDVMTDFLGFYQSRIKVLRLPHRDAKGPTWARYLCSHMWAGEEFFLQIDAHTNFRKGWDKETKDMFHQLGTRKAVISYYPPKDTSEASALGGKTVVTQTAQVNHKNELIAQGREVPATSFPTEGKFVGACFLFARYDFLLEIPFDPYLPYLFQGEEPLLAMRLFTHGWKVYHPTHCVCTHYYTRASDPKFWDDHKAAFDTWNPVARHRAEFLLGLRPRDPRVPDAVYRYAETYGAGRVRTRESWHRQLGVRWELK